MRKLFFMALISSVSLQIGLDAQQTGQNDSSSKPIMVGHPEGSKTIGETNPQNIQRTLSILKPDTVRNRHIGEIINRLENQGLHVAAIKMVKLNKEQAGQFYKVHKNQPYFSELVDFISSGPIVVMALEGDNAISKNREIMGSKNPDTAEEGTIRKAYASSITENAVHGSDTPEAAKEEILFFFQPNEINASN